MPLTQEQEEREHELRMELTKVSIDQAKASIEQMRANVDQIRASVDQMRVNSDKLRNDMRYEGRKFAAQFVVAIAAAVGAGAALANWVNSRSAPPAPVAPPAATAPAPRG